MRLRELVISLTISILAFPGGMAVAKPKAGDTLEDVLNRIEASKP